MGPREGKPSANHVGSYGVVYVNDIGREALLSTKAPTFPTGSIIVREKLAKAEDKQPQLVAAMIKRASGFSPQSGDWEYLILDGALKKIRERQKKGACLDCHQSQRARDFVYAVPATK